MAPTAKSNALLNPTTYHPYILSFPYVPFVWCSGTLDKFILIVFA